MLLTMHMHRDTKNVESGDQERPASNNLNTNVTIL